jgi:hypothetical protein
MPHSSTEYIILVNPDRSFTGFAAVRLPLLAAVESLQGTSFPKTLIICSVPTRLGPPLQSPLPELHGSCDDSN